MFDFSVSTQTGLSVIIIILLVWVLLAVQSMGDRVLSLESSIRAVPPSTSSSPIQRAPQTTPIIDLTGPPPQVFEPFSSPSSPSSFRILDTPYASAGGGGFDTGMGGLQFSSEGKGWTGMAINKNNRYSEFF